MLARMLLLVSIISGGLVAAEQDPADADFDLARKLAQYMERVRQHEALDLSWSGYFLSCEELALLEPYLHDRNPQIRRHAQTLLLGTARRSDDLAFPQEVVAKAVDLIPQNAGENYISTVNYPSRSLCPEDFSESAKENLTMRSCSQVRTARSAASRFPIPENTAYAKVQFGLRTTGDEGDMVTGVVYFDDVQVAAVIDQ